MSTKELSTKLHFYSDLAEQATGQLTSSRENWTAYLNTAARLYKYPFAEQLMIHAQRPNATACAPIETWNKSMNRSVKRGAKGIALIDDSSGESQLKYVYDYADTEEWRQNSRRPFVWQMKPEHETPVMEALAKNYGDTEGTLAEVLYNIAENLADEYYNSNARDIQYSVDGSYMEDYGEDNIRVTFRDALTVSTAYSLMSRCGLDSDDYFDDEDFNGIFDFNTLDTVNALGTAVSDLSEQVLRDIEVTIKNYERSKSAERSTNYGKSDVQQTRGLSSSQSNAERTAGSVNREIRTNAANIPTESQENIVQLSASEGEIDRALGGDRSDGKPEAGAVNGRIGSERPAAGQSDRSDGMGSAQEQSESASGGNDTGRTDIQLESNRGKIPAGGAADEAVPFSMDELAWLHSEWNEYLLNAIVREEPVLNAALNSDRENTITEIESAVRRIRLVISQDIVNSSNIQNKGQRINELDNYFDKERTPPLAQQLYNSVIRSDEYKERLAELTPKPIFIKDDNDIHSMDLSAYRDGDVIGYNAKGVEFSVGRMDTFTYITTTTKITTWGEILGADDIPADILRQIRTTNGLEAENADNMAVLENRENGSQFGTHFSDGQEYIHITDILEQSGISSDTVDEFIRDGGNKDNSVLRIAAHYMKGKTPAENIDFLKNEYKVGGKGLKIDGERYSSWFDETGVTIAEGAAALHAIRSVTLTWEQVESRIRELLYTGQYIPQNVIDTAAGYERKSLADKIWYLHQDLADGTEFFMDRDIFRGGFPDSTARINEMLSQPEQLNNIIEGLSGFADVYEQDRSVMRFHLYKPREISRLLSGLRIEPVAFTAGNIPTVSRTPFVSDDDIEAVLRRGSNIEEGKFRVYSYFLHEHTSQEKADFLRNEYGTGGSYPALPGIDNLNEWHEAKGIGISRGGISEPSDKVIIPWSRAARMIDELINTGRYMNRDELDRLPEYEKNILSREIYWFHNELPPDMYRPYTIGANYYDAVKAIHPMLDDPAQVDALIESMRPIWEVTPPEDRYYNTRQKAYADLTAYRDGTFTLFPQLSTVAMPEDSVTVMRPSVRREEESDQLSLFSLPTVEEQQQSLMEQAGDFPPAVSTPVVEQSDIDEAIRNWNGSLNSKLLVYTYMSDSALARSRNAAENLKEEYSHYNKGGVLSAFTVTKNGAESVVLPWAKVQRRIAQLMEANEFLLPDEQAYFDREHNDMKDDTVVTVAENIYNLFERTFPQIINGSYLEMTFRNPENKHELTISHDTTNAGLIHFDISYYEQNGTKVFDPMITFESDFENRTLKLIQYANTLTGEDIGILSIPSPNDARRLEALSVGIHQFLEGVKEQGFVLSQSGVFHDADGRPLPAEPKPNISAFLKEQADRESAAHFNVLRNMPGIAAESSQPQEIASEKPAVFTNGTKEPEQNAPMYSVGDTVYLENDRHFIVDEIGDREIILSDPTLIIPIFRSIDVSDFEALLQENPRNNHMFNALPDNQHIETIDGVDFVFTGISPQKKITPQPQNRINFHITDDHLGEGGAKVKFNYNAEAIRLLKHIESENRLSTPAEQETLSRYVGWGGLPQAFDGDNRDWRKEYAELRDLLTPDEYEMARASTLNAHYTSPSVIKAIYETVERMGFSTGNILEPACGVGNFLGLLPDSMAQSKLYGVELDSITGRLARQLYQKADITISGFEKTDTPDSFFDVAVGNVPFGNYKVVDKRYDKHNFLIHDYFFAKTLDQVRPGGIVAFITSKGTLDKQNANVRKYIAQRAELLGAVRLPNNAFLKNAGTEVTSDIIFLQKRDRLIDIEPDWVHLGQTDNGIPVNSYFADHPEMILGTMAFDDMMYGNGKETTCNPIPGADLAEQLRTALANIQGEITEPELDDIGEIADASVPANPAVRNYSYTLVDNKVYYRENSRMFPVDQAKTTLERIRGMITLRDCVHELIDYQLNDYSDGAIAAKQSELNRLYDRFTEKYGLINTKGNSLAFSNDSAYYLLCSLEILDENNELARKADMFTKRTIKQKNIVTSVDTAAEALAVSIAERACVDIGYMAQLMGGSEKIGDIVNDLRGVIFKDPLTGAFDLDGQWYSGWQTADEYLSGNVREKLRIARAAAEKHPEFAVNADALEKVQPKDLGASEIAVKLGTTWIDKEYIQQFMYQLLQPSIGLRNVIQVHYSPKTGEWGVTGTRRVPYNDVLAGTTYGTSRMNAYEIIRDTLNLKDVRIYDTKVVDGKETRVLNKKETTLAAQKQDAIKQAFKDWIFKDPERRQTLVSQYNEMFNSVRPREYDGSHINFSGISPEITLRPHQLNAIAHILYGGNTLLAHEVGAGKTFEMVGAAMESKQLGLCNKSLFAVPNHLTEQWASEFLRLYPSANILVATAKDFETKNRKKFCAKISTGDYDAVIIGHSQLEKIPMSKERQERLLREQIAEITEGIDELKRNQGERFSIKQLEKTKKNLETRLAKLTDGSRKDDVVTFEQLGVDRLFVDESHNFKNLFLFTKMRNVAGLSQTEAQKSSDMFMKCRYMDELTGNRGIIFATGTPISNSMTEMYTIHRYLQYDTLQKKNMTHFDCWASNFGETQTAIELAPEGTGYRARTRFAKFHNLPELVCMLKEVADIKTADTLDLPRPKANFHTVVVEPSDIQKEMVADLSERAAAVHNKQVKPEVDNMLKITSDGRKIGLDQRLMNDMLPDNHGSKVNVCAENIYNIWRETHADRLTQLCFCDFSTPNADGRFNVYDDIKEKLTANGVPEDEIAFIHDANTELRKKELFAKVRQGKVRILFGSTFKMGSGTNVQDRLIAMHDLDCPWRPSDLEQRAGRIIRQGNMNPEVDIYRYATGSTFDAYLWQTIENKQKFISQVMTSKSPMRSCEDIDETALSYAEIKALCAGNPLIKEKMDLDIEVARLRLLKSDYQSQHYRLEDALVKHYPENIAATKKRLAGYRADKERLASETKPNGDGFSPMTVHGVTYAEKGEAGAALLKAFENITTTEPAKIGSYRGFDMSLSFDSFNKEYKATFKGGMSYATPLGSDTFGNITRINNLLNDIPDYIANAEKGLENLYQQVENAKKELETPFQFEAELTEKSERLAVLDAELNMDNSGSQELADMDEDIDGDEDIEQEEQESEKSVKPSILDSLKANLLKIKLPGKEKSADACL